MILPYLKKTTTYRQMNIVFKQYVPPLEVYKWAAAWQNQQSGMCAQPRLRSAWASAQSDQSLRCPHEESLGP